ncbi:hypothetical protein BKA70DRAFT_346402 [Coprinopsis sp. MPI-PUGE-AT-0042]|nr:hypothetical protein BKA70DRAFT_346402 [Coprinopsis sp. MPI-PUGE-AT-0042]
MGSLGLTIPTGLSHLRSARLFYVRRLPRYLFSSVCTTFGLQFAHYNVEVLSLKVEQGDGAYACSPSCSTNHTYNPRINVPYCDSHPSSTLAPRAPLTGDLQPSCSSLRLFRNIPFTASAISAFVASGMTYDNQCRPSHPPPPARSPSLSDALTGRPMCGRAHLNIGLTS